ncbi:MAG: hypothetical protein AMXMBFR84_36350 [Candidatus Hydrogenedentota bacterium]
MTENVIFGWNVVMEALHAGNRLNRLFVAQDSKVRQLPVVLEAAKAAGVQVERVPVAKLNHLTQTREHQGLAAILSPLAYMDLAQFLLECPAKALVIALDHVQNPRNVGMIIRSAAAAGSDAVLLSAKGGAVIDEQVLKASAGAAFRVPIVLDNNLMSALGALREADFWLYGLDAEGRDDVFGVKWPTRVVLVMGNETKGLRPAVRKACDALVRIPLANGVESLNAAVAAGIALYQARTVKNG